MKRLGIIAFFILPGWLSATDSRALAEYNSVVRPFLKEYCINCHGAGKQKGDFRVDRLQVSKNSADAENWHLVLDNLNLGEMPPEGKKQPPEATREKVATWIAGELRRAARALKGDSGEVVFRRMNRKEFEYTIEDLFGVKGEYAGGFPEDAKAGHFDNNGAALMLSPEQMEAYMNATDYILDRAIQTRPRPKTHHASFTLHDHNQRAVSNRRKSLARKKANLGNLTKVERERTLKEIEIAEKNPFSGFGFPVFENGKLRVPKPEDGAGVDAVIAIKAGYAAPDTRRDFRAHVPGWYRFAVTAYGAAIKEGSVRLQIAYGDFGAGKIPKIADVLHLYSEIPKTYEYKVYLQPNQMVKLTMLDGSNWAPREKLVDLPGPFVVIRNMEMEGPLIDEWPPRGHRFLLGERDAGQLEDNEMPTILADLAPRLFRRHIAKTVIKDYLDFYETSRNGGKGELESFKLTVKAMMASPFFLYHVEPGNEVDAYALANRLSYFLWKSAPDEKLMNLAANGQLLQKQTLRQETERLLADPKSGPFREDFASQWLGINKVGEMQPDQSLYPEYDLQLEAAMTGETLAYLAEMLENDLGLGNFLHSDWTMLNARLAKHYGISGVKGNQFRKVSLAPHKTVRGGILTHASILNITSNGTTTSPVVRGTWILDRLLGNPAPPPPPDVPAIEPDIRGASTIKEQLSKHREIEQCANCHKKIDPYGMALENFDVIGGWREKYRALEPTANPNRKKIIDGKRIDINDTLPRHGQFTTFQEFRDILKGQESLLYDNMADQLATYALGRSMGYADEDSLETIVQNTRSSNGGLRTMVKEIVSSDLFRKP